MTTALIFQAIEDFLSASVTSRLDKVFWRQRTISSVTGACFTRPWRNFTLKTHQMFSLHTTPGKNPTITGHFGFALEKNLGQGNHMVLVTSSFSKSSVLKVLSFRTKTKNRRFQILPFEERFRKVPFSWRISVDGRRDRRNKAGVFKFLRGSVDGP